MSEQALQFSSQDINRMGFLKDLLVDQIEGTSDWRKRKADEYSDDPRNVSASDELAALAAHIKNLPDDHHLFQVMRTVIDECKTDFHMDEENALIRLYGFHGPGDVNSFVDELTAIYAYEIERNLDQ